MRKSGVLRLALPMLMLAGPTTGHVSAQPADLSASVEAKNADRPTMGDHRNGVDRNALPGIVDVALADGLSPGELSFAAQSGYGFTESIAGGGKGHHRMAGLLAVGYGATNNLSLALRLSGRFDSHPDDRLGPDDGYEGAPTLSARYGIRFGEENRILLGAQIDAAIPGRTAPSLAFDAATVDSRGLLAYAVTDNVVVASQFGYRFDNSANAKPDLNRLRSGDRIALGLSDSNAVLFGLGAIVSDGATEYLVDASADLLVGSKAPTAAQSPLRVAAGIRHHLGTRWQLLALATYSPSSRPSVGANDPLVPIEPRFIGTVGLAYAFGTAPATGSGRVNPTDPVIVVKAPPKPDEPLVTPAHQRTFDLEVVVLGGGRSQAGVQVDISINSENTSLPTDANGRISAQKLPVGELTVRVQANGFRPFELKRTVSANEIVQLEAALQDKTPAGQMRGLIRSFGGTPVRAEIEVEPLGTTFQTETDGTFKVDVPPGKYKIKVRASGYESQYRSLKVEDDGVTVLNIDLRRRNP
ncbi:MAG: carboxypeptidase-like regulatory domain-containing protein [Deltaproteobacteria bacterium]|nr:carboxypeptidase-like regulatory domain-containing protein [Deltaproteobacteria bacterium]